MSGNRRLKRFRRFTASLVLAWVLLLFFDVHQWIPESIFIPLRHTQFVPALQLSLGLATGAMIALGALLLMAFLFGRAYCSFLCPLGIFQDALSRIRIRRRKRNKNRIRKRVYRKQKPYRALRYAFLVVLLIAVLSGSGLFMGILDPYSWFGRMAQNIFHPVAVGINNALAWGFNAAGSFALSPVKFHGISWASLILSSAFLSMLVIMVWKNGRVYCNTVCPVGTLLGLAGKNALYRIRFDDAACTSCGLCAMACKAGCIDVKERSVDHERCVVCFNCIPACDQGGMSFSRSAAKATDESRRDLLVRAGTTLVLPAVLKEPTEKAKAKAVRRAPIAPPGALSHANLHINCTACHLCVSACPTGVIRPAVGEYGLMGVFQPFMDPIAGYCNYDCTRCLEVCPTGAITKMNEEEKKAVQIGRARFIPELCVVTKDFTACGACSEHCPTKAVNMVPWVKGLQIPEVDNTICVGCGACEYACPTDPRSIVVDGNPIHQIAEEPKGTGEEAEEVEMEEFPF